MANTIRDTGGLKYVEMQSGRFARKPLANLFDSGTWTTIRICLLLKAADTGANLTGTPALQFGLCSGTTNIPGDATPTNAVGMRTDGATWTRSAVANNERYYDITGAPFKNVGGAVTSGTTFTNFFQIMTDANTNGGVGCPLFVDIAKGSPNYSLRPWYATGNPTSPIITTAQWEAQSIATTPSFTNMFFDSAKTIAFDESAGTLDAAFVYWNQSSTMRVLNWRVVKIA